jgi:hypothetical protein
MVNCSAKQAMGRLGRRVILATSPCGPARVLRAIGVWKARVMKGSMGSFIRFLVLLKGLVKGSRAIVTGVVW